MLMRERSVVSPWSGLEKRRATAFTCVILKKRPVNLCYGAFGMSDILLMACQTSDTVDHTGAFANNVFLQLETRYFIWANMDM